MTLEEVRDLVLLGDETAQHYFSTQGDQDFTVWREVRRVRSEEAYAMDVLGWSFTIDRFTRQEFDHVAAAIESVLLEHSERVSYEYTVSADASTGFIRHLFTCEGY